MTERRGTKALELWCRRITDGYPGVNVQNMTTSWRDGLAFCAMIHHFRPDLIDFDSLNKDDVYGNNELAFRTAAEHLGIPALLDAEDMASCSVPDRLSILTYLSQFYQNFGGSSPSRLALSRTKESSNEGISPVVAESTKPKMGPRVGMRREPCAVCGMPVFLAEKLMISRTPYHRTCFRCARCGNQLTPGNYYETEDSQYCCETCPDEESTKSSSSPILHQAYNAVMMDHENDPIDREINLAGYQRSLSDEEKTERRAQLTEEILDRVLIRPPGAPTNAEKKKISSSSSSPVEAPTAENISQTAQMRLSFMASQMLAESPGEDAEKSAGYREKFIPAAVAEDAEESNSCSSRESSSSSPGDEFAKRRSPEGASDEKIADAGCVEAAEQPSTCAKDRGPIGREFNSVDIDRSSCSVFSEVINDDEKLVDSLENVEEEEEDEAKRRRRRRRRSFDTATSEAAQRRNDHLYLDDKDASIRQDTKDKLVRVIDREDDEGIENGSQCLSLVQRRLKMFENPGTMDGKKREEQQVKSLSSPKVEGSSLVDGKIIADEIFEEETKIEDNDAQEQPEISSHSEDAKLRDRISSSRTEEDEESNKIEDNLEFSISPETNLPPVVPKRVGLEARKTARSRAKNAEVTVLNAPGIDLSTEEMYPKDLNPFKSDEEEEVGENFENSRRSKVSTNPFGSSDDDDEDNDESLKVVVVAPPRPATRSNVAGKKSPRDISEDVDEAPTKRLLKAPQIHLNPFWSDDDEEPDTEDECGVHSLPANTPIPKPRTIKQTSHRKSEFERGDIYASNSSLGSTGSTSTHGRTYRKKKPAPPPPIAKELFTSSADFLLSPSRTTYTGSNNSLHTTPRARKARPAPPPPLPTSTPYSANLMANLALTESPITDAGKITESEDYKTWEEPKIGKDEANRNKQSSMATISCDETNVNSGYADKSVQGKWKRKKGPAPARPIPHRRKIKVMSLKDVKLELDEIEMQQQGLEKQGVRLEQLIRDKAETGNAAEETSLGMDVEELVLELFVLVNEKNELFRRQAELMLLRRQQRLEEEHADIEYQIRCLLCQPEATKTDFDKQREETLIQRLVEIVERRNEIVECLEMDRRREVEEDRSINTQMGLYAAKNKGDYAKELEDETNSRARKSRRAKLKEKAKEKILRKGHKKDADKDVDESEVKLKRQNKKKWF